MQDSRDGVTRRGDAGRAAGILRRDFDEAERRQGVESFCHGEIEGAPAGGPILEDLRGEHDEHDDERLGPGAFCETEEDGAHFEGRGFAGPKRVRDRRPIFGAVLHNLFVGLWWRPSGFQHRTPIEFGFFLRHTGIDRQCQGAGLNHGVGHPRPL